MALLAEQELQKTFEFFAGQQCPQPWRAFLGAMADEFGQRLTTPELRLLMSRIGGRIARQLGLPACRTLGEFQHAVNTRLTEFGWGWARIEDAGEAIVVRHYCAPLSAVFGADAEAWAPALLEGAYQEWFKAVGADPALTVRQRSSAAPTVAGALEYRLER